MGDRVVHRPGNALTEDFGRQAYDVVFTAQLVHHLSEKENRDLAIRVARALRPGGVYAILEEFRPRTAKDAGQLGALLEFYFALTSESGTWARKRWRPGNAMQAFSRSVRSTFAPFRASASKPRRRRDRVIRRRTEIKRRLTNQHERAALVARVQRLTPESARLWGRMTAHQAVGTPPS